MVFAAERDRPDRAFDGVVVEVDATVLEKARELLPTGESVADCFGQGAAAWDTRELGLQPRLHRLDQRLRFSVTDLLSLLSGAAADRDFDLVEFGNPAQRLGGNWRA